ncbi:hypothetical protein AB1Y20_016640 [Prymnesium parvum]|uniref:Serine/threonine-protein kinase TOR n=1 Tax=Prymnesium parvum TaxID=97485 RepID=A0AB34ICX1_PRYPA
MEGEGSGYRGEWDFVKKALPSRDEATVRRAIELLGHLARYDSAAAEPLELQLWRALEWMREGERAPQLHVACLVLAELAQNAPTLTYLHIRQIFESILVAIRNPQQPVREAAARALRACLSVIRERGSRQRAQWYSRMFEEAVGGLLERDVHATHGSLLALAALLDTCGPIDAPRLAHAFSRVWPFKESRHALLRHAVLHVLPLLASRAPAGAPIPWVGQAAEYLVASLRSSPEHRGALFLATGRMAAAVGAPFAARIPALVRECRDALAAAAPKPFGRHAPRPCGGEALGCLAMLVASHPRGVAPHLPELLPAVFRGGLSVALRETLAVIVRQLPELLPEVQWRVLELVSLALTRLTYRQWLERSIEGGGGGAAAAAHAAEAAEEAAAVAFALDTIGSFDLRGCRLLRFACECVSGYLDDGAAEVRAGAARACCNILLSDAHRAHPATDADARLADQVLERVLLSAVSDEAPTIRHAILAGLSRPFDAQLAKPSLLDVLTMTVHDADPTVRDEGVRLLGRVSLRNPSHACAALRSLLMSLLTEIDAGGSPRRKAAAASLLGTLVCAAPHLTPPYAAAILAALLPLLLAGDADVATAALATLGELSVVAGGAVGVVMPTLLPRVLPILHDQASPHTRRSALRAMSQLLRSTGYSPALASTHPAPLLHALLSLLRTEQDRATRLELLRALGVIGAADPRLVMGTRPSAAARAEGAPAEGVLGGAVGPAHADFYPTVALRALTRILRDPSLSAHHAMAIQSITQVLQSLGVKCVPFLPAVHPLLLHASRSADASLRETAVEHLGYMVGIIRLHVRKYVPSLLALVQEHLRSPGLIQIHCIAVVEQLSSVLNDEFRGHLVALMPMLLSILHADSSDRRLPTLKLLRALRVFSHNMAAQLHMVLPAVLRICEQVDTMARVRTEALQLLHRVCTTLDVSVFGSRIVHGLVRVHAIAQEPDDRALALQILRELVRRVHADFAVFLPLLGALQQHAPFESALQPSLLRRSESERSERSELRRESDEAAEGARPAAWEVNRKTLQAAWEATQRSTREDWHEWIRRLSVEMIRESPQPSMRACAALAQVYQPLSRQLFNAAFLSCWGELDADGYQASLVACLETALDADHMSLEVLQPLLNLAEFMEQADKPLPIDIRKLGALAEKCHAFAKALHYREVEFHSYPADTIEALISINNQLQQPEAAKGILTYALRKYQVDLKESWYEKLHRWGDARTAYERKEKEDPSNLEWTLGRMRCQRALGEWGPLCQLARDKWQSAQLEDAEMRAEVARLAAAGAWNLRLWDEMELYCASIPNDSVESCFFRALLSIHSSQYKEALGHIDDARRQLDSELTASVGESYRRAYSSMIQLQQLSELEEMLLHKEEPNAMPLPMLVDMWRGRLVQAQHDVDVWQEILSVRYLVAPPSQDMHTWLKFSALCRKSGKLAASLKILSQILEADPAHVPEDELHATHPQVAFAYIKHLWEAGAQQEGLRRLRSLVHHPRTAGNPALAAKGWLKLGTWERAAADSRFLSDEHTASIFHSLRRSTEHNPSSYKAWHAWAMINFEAVSKPDGANRYVVPAVQGFFRSISLGRERALQDTLRLLTLWFKYGGVPNVNDAVLRGFDSISIDTWLSVTPQIIARIHSQTTLVRRSVHLLLHRVAKEHPQGLIYPLTVAAKSHSQPRQSAALRVLSEMRKQCDKLVEQAALVSMELIRTSILWHEMWHTALEEASRLYFGNQDVEGMLATLEPLHRALQRGPETAREASFQQAFGAELQHAHELCQAYRQSQNRAELHAAWDVYYNVFRRISKQIAKLNVLELQHVSPKLLEARDLELAVPGTYYAGAKVVCIGFFARSMAVIASKQRPRKLTIHGSDGGEHAFLLKGHEDLRQDERVMQLFGLVNTLLSTDRDTSKQDLAIRRYSVVPLSPNSGLISWVAECDTLHALIKEFRDARKIMLNVEHRLMMMMAPDFEGLPVLNKLEVFEYALNHTPGHDLTKVLWLRSKNAEHWLTRRTNYTCSLAVMSMVGYILGLGDRHPSNLMLDRLTGKLLHIDFGDCFEVAVHREKFPEKIPFRLTRMLVNAMEVSGIEGNFRSTCEAVMTMLRNNEDSVMAMLEAFVYDPLINWRLLVKPPPDEATRPRDSSISHFAEGTLETSGGERRMTNGWAGGDDELSASHAQAMSHPASIIGTPQQHHAASFAPLNSSVISVSKRSRVEPVHHDERALNERAISVLRRVKAKLVGSDFQDEKVDVSTQVDLLVQEAQSNLNLCQLYIGWCPFW